MAGSTCPSAWFSSGERWKEGHSGRTKTSHSCVDNFTLFSPSCQFPFQPVHVCRIGMLGKGVLYFTRYSTVGFRE